MHRCFIRRGVILLMILAAALTGNKVYAGNLVSLRVLQQEYPRAFFFRSAESFAANPRVTYAQWDKTFSRLMGIEGKTLEEEVPGRSIRNIDFFTRFKKEHPDQLVLLHYNGNARDPRDQSERFFAGHWIYYNGAQILKDISAENGETDISVDHPELFHVEIGRYRNANEDIGLCRLDAQGRPDWRDCEQVQLVSVDVRKRTIRVRRGCYGTTPLAFSKGHSYAAAHETEGPWGGKSHLLWFYNYSTCCPRDANGRTCSDLLAAELGQRFGAGGELAAYDGLEFDVLHNRAHGGGAARAPDCDADGKPDSGVLEGVNRYGIGVIDFCRKVRAALGDNKLVLADGMSLSNQRAFGILNGIESEGWPRLNDWEIRDWSGGLNRHFFWAQNAHAPVFNYINHKFVQPSAFPGIMKRPDVPFTTHRLVLAAAVMTDSALCYSFLPRPEPGETLGIWDELRMGTENRTGWLGRPLGPAVHLAKQQRNLVADRQPTAGDRAIKYSSTDSNADSLRFRFRGLPTSGPDLFVSLRARSAPRAAYPSEMARLVWVGIAPPEGQFMRDEPPGTGMQLRGKDESEILPNSGASVHFRRKQTLGGEIRDAYQVHPPYKQDVGYTFWTREVSIPNNGVLSFDTGMGVKSPERSDGVTFAVEVAAASGGRAGKFERVFEESQVASRWIHHDVPLTKWFDQKVQLKFIADCGPNNNATTDHAYWGDVWVLGPEGRGSVTPSQRFMTWVNGTDFQPTFYFSDIRSPTVDLEFVVEGSEPVWISDLEVYGAPDVMYREFEKGVVLANPSPRPYDWDLAKLFPNQRFRRLRGSANQDPETNNGQAVAHTVTLALHEGLFLVKRKR